jgi:hypothetical protein
MPRSIEFSVDSAASVGQIYFALRQKDYWLARLANFDGSGRMDSLTVDSDGCVTAILVHDLRPDGLPGPVAKFFPHQWRVVETETWQPIDHGRVRGEFSVLARGAPGSYACMALLTPTRHGSRLKCAATVAFRVPLIGGKIEGLMADTLTLTISEIQDFTTGWIREHA